MADGYARSTGKPGVVLVTSGPGATNTVTGLLTALMDSVPMIVLTGQTISPMLGKDAFQEADVTGITYPVVKHSYLVKDPNDIPRITREAFHLASTGRPGPVLIDLPKDVTSGPCTADFVNTVDLPGYIVPGHPEAGSGEEGGGADQPEPQAGAVRRPRRGDLGRGPGDHEARREAERADRQHAARQGRVSRGSPAAPGDARHARHRLRQQGGHRLRHDHGDRRALGRPHHRQAVGVLRRRDQDPHRHRQGRVQQDRAPRRQPGRRRAPGRRGSDPARAEARHRRVARADRGVAQAVPAQVREEGRPARAARARPARRARRARRDPDHRRGPAPDVGGAVLPDHQEPPLAVVGRRRHHGLRLPGGDRRAVRATRRRRSGRSSATAASR